MKLYFLAVTIVFFVTIVPKAVNAAAGPSPTPSTFTITVPAGMKLVQTQNGNTIQLSIVPAGSPTPATHATAGGGNTVASSGSGGGPPTVSGDASSQLSSALTTINLDRPLSAAPAFVALGVSPETVNNPSTPRDFAASILNGVDYNGVLQNGLAVETAPYQVLFGGNTTLKQYQDSYLTQVLYNTSLSLGTTKASDSGTKAVRLALGFSFTLYNAADPRTNSDLEESLHNIYSGQSSIPPYPYDASLTKEQNDAASKAWYAKYGDPNAASNKVLTDFATNHWSASSLQVAIAPIWLSEDGKANDLHSDGFSAWVTYAYGFEQFPKIYGHAQFLTDIQYIDGQHVSSTTKLPIITTEDSLLTASRLRVGSATFNGSLEAAYLRIWNGPIGDHDAFRVGGSIEKQLAPNLWFVLSAGQQFGKSSDNELFAIGSFRLGSEDKSTFAPPSQ